MSTHLHPRASAAIGRAGGRLLRNRMLMRLPIRLYHARLGFLFSSRILMLEHRGRRTGANRYVVLEVVDHPAADTYVVASGFGRRAQWFRNVSVEPHVRVWVGRRGPTAATARLVSTTEADAALHAYVGRHRRFWNTMKPVLQNTLGTAVSEQDTQLPMVELRMTA